MCPTSVKRSGAHQYVDVGHIDFIVSEKLFVVVREKII